MTTAISEHPATADASSVTQTPRRLRDYGYLLFTGITMGAADVVPGVSGGTMAFIMGVYQELIDGIKSFDLELARMLVRGDVRGAMGHVPWKFLAVLVTGILMSVLTLAHAVSWLLDEHQELLYAVFFGMVVASIVTVSARVRWTPRAFVGLVVGTAVAWWVVGLVPVDMPNGPLVLFLSGTVAISAMILPGISGSFILLILGQYAYVIGAIKGLEILVLLPFALGCGLGLMGFSRVLSWLFEHFEQLTVTLLVGFMLGSLRKIWPFKVTLETMVDRHGEVVPLVQENVLPNVGNAATWIALGLAIVGFVLIMAIDRLRARLEAS